jgi:large repetitive protein
VYGEIIVNVVGKPGAPGAPVEQSVGDGYVLLAWTAPPTNGAPITAYQVTGSPSYHHTCQTTVCKLTGLTNGKKYTFTVAALNRVGAGPASAPSDSMEPDVVPDQPSAPVTTFGDKQITLDWPQAHSSGSAVKYYLIQISPPISAPVQVTGTHMVWTGLTNGTSYTFRIKAYNDAPNGSTWSAFSSPEIPAAAPDAPLAPTAAGVADGIGKQMVVDWQPPNNNGAPITAYDLSVYRAGSLVQTLAEDGDSTRTTVSVENGVSYTFRITATNKAGVSKQSAASAAQVAHGKPSVVTSFSVTDHSGSTGYNGAVKYTLSAPNDNGMAITTYQFTYSGGSVDASSSSTSGTISGLTNGQSYSFKVRACNDMCGDWSAASSSVSPYGPPPQPNVSGAASGTTQVQFTWSSGGTNGRPIDHMSVSVDGGGWQSKAVSSSLLVGNGPGQTHSIQVRAVDSAGQQSSVASASATSYAPPATVTLTHGASTNQPDCHSPCNYVVITLQNFPANTSVTCTLDSGHAGGVPFATESARTDANGNRSWQSDAYYGFYGTYLQASCNGVVGRNNSW